jgi:ABC-type transport system involved in multi-copper enzyme maturation permease subunit
VLTGELRSEWMRGRGRPVEKYAAIVVLVLGTLIPIVMILMSSRNAAIHKSAIEMLAFPSSLRAARTMATLLGPFWAAALGANVVGAEYQYGTWPWLLVRNTSRLHLVIVKLLAMSARIVALTLVGIFSFVVMAALVCLVVGAPVLTWSSSTTSVQELMVPFIAVAGAMAFAATIGLTITIVSRSVAFGTLTGALAQPFFMAIRFKETARWIPYVHLQNIEERLLTGRPSVFLTRFLEFDMSARASAGVLGIELLVLLAIAYLVFKRQEIVY